MTTTDPEGVLLSFDEYGDLIFTADAATRELLKAQVDEGAALLDAAHVELRHRILVYGQDTPEVKTQRRHLDFLNDRQRDDSVFLEWIEYWLCNGYSTLSTADIGALVDDSCVFISDASLDDDGKLPDDAKIWYYNHYAIRAYTDDLIQDGRMKWTLHKEAK